MPRKLACECGECETCRQRIRMRLKRAGTQKGHVRQDSDQPRPWVSVRISLTREDALQCSSAWLGSEASEFDVYLDGLDKGRDFRDF